ncbi:hypothetical protein EC991_001793 [Linnemannia zychae]|nr:hypothetical protein EC991_001793 [Linnemannia zychae]
MLSTRAQESQHFQWAGNVINVDPLSNLNPGPSLRRQDQQSQNQSQRDLPSTPRRTSQLLAEEASRRPLIAPPARQTHSTASVHDFGDGGFGGDNNGDGAYHSCSHEPHPVETVLPAQAPISIHGHRNNGSGIGDDAGAGGDLEMDYVLEEEEPGPPPIEVTLNIDIPKSSRPPTEGVPSTTVLNVNPSWHVVFVETIQQQRIRTSVRIQFCPNSSTSRLVEHRAKVRRLQTVQVIGYASCRVELSRRIRGQTLLNRGGLVLHLDPKSITFNEASYGFTLSLSSFEIGQLSQTHNSRPDIPIPLARQQNSAYCRRNLKEMYYDTITKDVAITLRPSGEVFYAHSVVLESHAYFRALIEQQYKSQSPLEGQGREDTSGMTVETEAVVDEEGYAQPLRPQLQQQRSSSYPTRGADGLYDSGGGLGQTDQVHSRTKIMIDVNDTSPTVFRAVLHYMYMGHVPITSVFQQPQQPGNPFASGGSAPGEAQDASGPSISTDTHAGNEPSSSSSGITGLEALTVAASIAATESSSTGGPSIVPPPLPQAATAPTAASVTPGAATTSSGVLTGTIDPAAPAAPQLVTATMQLRDFPWRELYEIATRYQLSGLVHLTKVSLLSRLDVEQAIRELFEWSYHHRSLIPAYVSFLIERVDAMALGSGGAGGGGGGASILWPYHDICPAFDEIMMEFMRLLNERRDCGTMI